MKKHNVFGLATFEDFSEILFEANKDILNEEIILLIILDIIKILNIYWIDYSLLVLYYIFNCY